ncbi:MAG: methyltransferase domain-containing protein [Planctomycetaceae bacterium]
MKNMSSGIIVAAFLLSTVTAQEKPTQEKAEQKESAQKPNPSINEKFLSNDLDVAEWLGRFEIESREVYAHQDRVLDNCGIQPGQTVADIGAGTGFYVRRFAEAVGSDGWVYAVDIAPRFLQHINTQAHDDNIANLTTVLCSEQNVRLPPKSVDVAFICDTYHHFEHHEATLASLHLAMRDGGLLNVVDFERIPGKSREFILGHVRAGKEVFRAEIEAAGFEFVKEVTIPGFEENYFLQFRKGAKPTVVSP